MKIVKSLKKLDAKLEKLEEKLEKFVIRLQKSEFGRFFGKFKQFFYVHLKEILASLVSLSIFVGTLHLLPTWKCFISLDDISGRKGRIVFSAAVSLFITAMINQLINKELPNEKDKCFRVLLILFFIEFFSDIIVLWNATSRAAFFC